MFASALLLFVALAVIALREEGKRGGENEEPFRVAFVYIGPPGDMGWTHEHERGNCRGRVFRDKNGVSLH
jgi:basic membrane lipoprotein Med (substrate-binding protein (PBP1-ABC) superfamily)